MDPSTGTEGRPSGAPSSRAKVLWAVRRAPEARAVDDLADEVGLHPNTVRFHLSRLEHQGLVRRQVEHHNVPGRPALRFTAVPQPAEDRRGVEELAQMLASVLGQQVPGSAALTERAGRAWAARLMGTRTGPAPDAAEAIGLLVEALAGVGFDPQVSSDGRRITVLQRRCPFLEVAREHRDVVCSVQLGLLRGLLERLGAPLEVTRLVPFATPEGCLVHLTAT